jgi:hypothetical protein
MDKVEQRFSMCYLMSGDFSKHGCFCEKVLVKTPS